MSEPEGSLRSSSVTPCEKSEAQRGELTIFKKFLFIHFQREGRGRRERERETLICWSTYFMHSSVDSYMCRDWGLNLQPCCIGTMLYQLSYSAKPELTMLNADSFWLSIIASFLLEFWECHILPRQGTCTRQLLPIQHTLSTCCTGSLGPASRRCDCLTT